MDRLNTYHNNNGARDRVENMMNHLNLKDVWRQQNPERKEFSWRKKGSLNIASRIDFALVSAGLDQEVGSILYVPSIKTDHRALYMKIDVCRNERGRGYWKLNSRYLREKSYIDGMNKELDNTIKSLEERNPQEKWECIKKRIKKYSIQYARDRVKEDQIIMANLSEKVNEYESSLPLTEDDDKLLELTKIDLEERLMKKAEGMIFRSKVKWYEEGEGNTKYFYSLEKQRYNAKTCFKVIDKNDVEYSQQDKILEVQKAFYKELYTKEKDINFTLENTHGIKVPDEIMKDQGIQLDENNIRHAIKKMKNDRTP